MEPCKIRGMTPSHAQGEGKELSSPSGRGRKMPLTSPLIDQAFALKTPAQSILSAMAIYHQSSLALRPRGELQCASSSLRASSFAEKANRINLCFHTAARRRALMHYLADRRGCASC